MNKVTLYLLNISLVKNNYDFICSFIDKNRLEKANRYVQEKDRLLSLGASYLLKKYLPSGDIKETKSGKPYLEDGPYFNISHSNEYIVLAVSSSHDIGVDIEYIDEKRMNSIKFVLTDKEKDIDDSNTLFRIWTNKESLVKCVSTGLKDIKSVDGLPLEGVRVFNNEEYYSRSFIKDNYSISVALRSSEYFDIEKIDII